MTVNTTPSGALIINKPGGLAGPTSHDVVAGLRRLIRISNQESPITKVGHAGTLDPFASGVLVVAVGPATRLLEYTRTWEKQYRAEFTLGASSDTDDLTGIITPVPNADPPTRAQLDNILRHFLGPQLQTPPAYSAVKAAGQKLYRLARSGHLAAARQKANQHRREINIRAISVISYQYPHLLLDITCSTGTYIRALARDLGQRLATGAYVSKLTRTAVGPMKLTQAINLENLNSNDIKERLLPPRVLVKHLPSLALPNPSVAKLKQGQKVGESRALPANQPLALFDEESVLFGIGALSPTERVLSPLKIFSPLLHK